VLFFEMKTKLVAGSRWTAECDMCIYVCCPDTNVSACATVLAGVVISQNVKWSAVPIGASCSLPLYLQDTSGSPFCLPNHSNFLFGLAINNCISISPPVYLSPVSHDKTARGFINRLRSHCPYVLARRRIPACPFNH